MECNVEVDWQTEALGQRWQSPARALEINAGDPDMVVLTQERWYIYTTDAGKSWKCAHTGTRIVKDAQVSWKNNGLMETSCWDYLIDPFDKNRRYIAQTDIGFSRSLDGGETWIWGGPALPKGVDNTTYQIAFDPDIKGKIFGAFSATHDIPNYNTIYGGHWRPQLAAGAVGVSLDYAATWKKLWPTKLPVTSIVLDPKSPKGNRTLYAALFEGGVWRSNDDGKTWEQCKNVGLGSQKNKRCLKLILQPDGSLLNLVTGKVKGRTDGVGLYRSTRQGRHLDEDQPGPGVDVAEGFFGQPARPQRNPRRSVARQPGPVPHEGRRQDLAVAGLEGAGALWRLLPPGPPGVDLHDVHGNADRVRPVPEQGRRQDVQAVFGDPVRQYSAGVLRPR